MWIILALSASLLWGLTYVVDEQIFKKVSVVSSLAIVCLITSIVMFFIAYVSGTLKPDLISIKSSKNLLVLVVVGTLTFILAELCIGLSISAKNAVLSGLVEISYPIFIVAFGYFLFDEKQINIYAIIGALLIYAGVTLIYIFNK